MDSYVQEKTCCWSGSVHKHTQKEALQAVVILLSWFKQLFQGLFQPPIHQPTPQPPPPFFFFFSLISARMKVTFLSLHLSTRTPSRSGLTAAHSRQCQAEIILSVKLNNEARDTDAPKNKHTPELWESTFAFEEWWGVVGRIKWMKWKGVFVFYAAVYGVCFIWYLNIAASIQSACGLLIYYKWNFPQEVTLWLNQKAGMWFR